MTVGKWAGASPMKAGDAVFVFNTSSRQLKYFHANGMEQWRIPARGVGSNDTFGKTPPGMYTLGDPQTIDPEEEKARSLGLAFIPMNRFISPTYDRNRRSDIGIHGGGSDLPQPLAAAQGWETTLGCIRVQNGDLGRVADAVRNCIGKGNTPWLTVLWFETVGKRQQSIGF